MKSIKDRLFAKGVMHSILSGLQEVARRAGRGNEVVFDEKRNETKVNCSFVAGKIVPNVDGFVPQVISYGLPCIPGTAALVIDTKDGAKVFKPRSVGDKAFLFFRNAVVFNLWQRQLEVAYISSRCDVIEGQRQWAVVFQEIVLYTIPSFVMSDAEMREFLRKELRSKLPESHLAALDELTLNPVVPNREHHDRQPNVGLSVDQQELAGKQAALQRGGKINKGKGNHPKPEAE